MLVIVGPSASGKTQIVKILIEQFQMKKMVTYTSRSKRKNEQEGRDYYFINREDFERKISANFFLEYVYYNENYYGTSRSSLDDNKVVILEPNGLRHYIKEAGSSLTVIFLYCSKEVLRIRMQNRGDDSEVIKRRLAGDDQIFNEEIAQLADYIIDTTPSNIYEDAKKIYSIYQKERMRKK